MKQKRFSCKTTMWVYSAKSGAWHFLSVPQKESDEIKATYKHKSKGWGSLPITITIGSTTWDTSLFPDSKLGRYIIPIKAAVRKKEHLVTEKDIRYSFILKTL